MNIRVKKIPLDELESFVNSTAFQELEIVPISTIRAKSYLANPHARPEDVVLFLAYSNNQLVAFRSIFADVVHSEGKNIHFGWCSGNWVHPKFRRKGISELLLNEAYEEWNQKLMFTNYAPNSEKLYLKTGKFKAIHLFNGARAYVFPKTRKLISNANKNSFYKLFYNLIDCCIRFYSFLLIPYYSKGHKSEIQFVETNTPDEECFSSIPSEHELFMHHKEKLE